MEDKALDKLDTLNYYVSDGIIILLSLVGIIAVSCIFKD